VSTSTTLRPSPPWLITSQPSVWSTAKLPSLRPVPKAPSGAAETTTSSTAAPVAVTTPVSAPIEPSEDYESESIELQPQEPPAATQPPQQVPVAPEVVVTTTSTAAPPSSTPATRKQTHPTTGKIILIQAQNNFYENFSSFRGGKILFQ